MASDPSSTKNLKVGSDPILRLPAEGGSDEKGCATKIISRLSRLAYRRPVTAADMQTLYTFFEQGRNDGGSFEAGIQFALERMLVDPDFLLRVYHDPRTARSAHGHVAPPERSGDCLEAVVLPVVAAFPTISC